MRNMTRLLAMLLSLMLVLSACGGNSAAPATPSEPAPETPAPAEEKVATFSEAGTYTGDYDEIVVTAPDTVLENVTAEKITIAKEVGDGDVTLNDVEVEVLEVYGCGENSLHVNRSRVGFLYADKQLHAAAVELIARIVLGEGTSVDECEATNAHIYVTSESDGIGDAEICDNSKIFVEENAVAGTITLSADTAAADIAGSADAVNVEAAGEAVIAATAVVADVNVGAAAEGAGIVIGGSVENLAVEGASVTVTVEPTGAVVTATVTGSASNTTLTVNGTVASAVLESAAAIGGTGSIEAIDTTDKANITTEAGSTAADSAQVTVNGEAVETPAPTAPETTPTTPATTPTTPSTSTGSTGSSSDSSSSDDDYDDDYDDSDDGDDYTPTYVAQIGTNKYTSLTAAVAAIAEGETVELLTSTELSADAVLKNSVKLVVPAEVTLTLKGNVTAEAGSTVEINGTVVVASGKLDVSALGYGTETGLVSGQAGKLVIKSGATVSYMDAWSGYASFNALVANNPNIAVADDGVEIMLGETKYTYNEEGDIWLTGNEKAVIMGATIPFGNGTVTANMGFSTIAEALNAAEGKTTTITLTSNITDPIVVKGENTNITLDLNGKSVSVSGSADDSITAIRVKENAILTIEGEGEVNGGAGCAFNVAVRADDSATVNIKGGSYSVGADKNGDGNSTIYSAGGTINISGGEFSSVEAINDFYYVLNKKNNTSGSISVSGGKFKNYNPAVGDDTGNPANFLADGFVAIKDAEGWYNLYEIDNLTASNSDEFNAVLEALACLEDAFDAQVTLSAGTYALNGQNAVNPVVDVTIVGADREEVILDSINGFAGCAFKNLTINDIYTIDDNTITDCDIVAPVSDVACATRVFNTTTFTGCTFTANGNGTSLWFDDVAGDAEVEFINCEFTDNIRLGGNESNHYTFTGCDFLGGAVNWSNALVITYAPATFSDCEFVVEEPALYGIRLAVGMTAEDITLTDGTDTAVMVP